MISLRAFVVALLLFMVTGPGFTQAADPADVYYQAQDWPKAAKAYGKVTKEQPTNGRAWYRLAVAQRSLGLLDDALESLLKAQENGVPGSLTGYERALVFAGSGKSDQAIMELENAAKAGFSNASGLEVEGLTSIRDTEEFEKISKVIHRNSAPCTVDEHHGDFDFWLGDWEVTDVNGNIQGSNSISKTENGCLMLEKWISVTGNTGQSMNYYDPHRNKWIQRWVSPSALINLEGNYFDGAMRLVGDIYYYGNKNYSKFRGTWTLLEDGRVQQYFEQSPDDGESWQPWFDGYYKRK